MRRGFSAVLGALVLALALGLAPAMPASAGWSDDTQIMNPATGVAVVDPGSLPAGCVPTLKVLQPVVVVQATPEVEVRSRDALPPRDHPSQLMPIGWSALGYHASP